MHAWLGLGANVHQPLTQVKAAIAHLHKVQGLEVSRLSSFYRSAPWGNEDQDDFVNAVVQVWTTLEPAALLATCLAIEDRMGRQRDASRWGPRVIDIDVLLYGNRTICSADLVVPHPYIHQRGFVLLPLCELDASLEVPGLGTVGSLQEQVDCSGVSRLDDQRNGPVQGFGSPAVKGQDTR